MKIVYCTIAYSAAYREISLELINTFLLHTPDNSHLIIITDDISFYDCYMSPKITFIEGIENNSPWFEANLKFQALQYVPLSADYVVMLDCDCFLTDEMLDDYFLNLKNGLNVPIGTNYATPNDIQNDAIRHKMLTLNKDHWAQNYYVFIERCFIIKVEYYIFHDFIKEWEQLYHTVNELKLTHAGEFVEIQLAARRSMMAIHSLHQSPLQQILFTRERNGAIASALR